jgi:hypothetical protein
LPISDVQILDLQMYTQTEREKAVQHADRQRRKRLDRKNVREREKRGIDTFELLLHSRLPTSIQRERAIFYQPEETRIVVNEQEDSDDVIYYDNHSIFNHNDNDENQQMIYSEAQDRMNEDDDDMNNYDFGMEDNEECPQSDDEDDQSKQQVQTRLHNYTDISTLDWCEDLLSFLRKGDVNKSHSTLLLKLVKSVLPVPNNMPSTTEEILSLLNVQDLFTKRSICLLCKQDLNYKETRCSLCQSQDHKTIANIFDLDIRRVLTTILARLEPNIEEYKQQINNHDDKEKTNDIAFCLLYQQLLKQNPGQNLISLLLHLDGVGLTRSTQLKLWLLSASIVELPSKLRHRRYNMVPMSIWVGYSEPAPDIWLKLITNELKYLKTHGICRLKKIKITEACIFLFLSVVEYVVDI